MPLPAPVTSATPVSLLISLLPNCLIAWLPLDGDAQVDERDGGRGLFSFSAATVADNASIFLCRVLLADWPQTDVAFTVTPRVPVPGVHLQDWLEFLAAPVDTAPDERHGALLGGGVEKYCKCNAI